MFGLGDNTFGLPNGIYVPPGVSAPVDDKYRSDSVLNKPLYLGLAVPRFPQEARGIDTGIVIVDITVDRDGGMTYDIKAVYPSACGFGPAVEWVIQRGQFAPLIVDGLKVTHTTRLTLIMTRSKVLQSSAVFTDCSPEVNPVWLERK